MGGGLGGGAGRGGPLEAQAAGTRNVRRFARDSSTLTVHTNVAMPIVCACGCAVLCFWAPVPRDAPLPQPSTPSSGSVSPLSSGITSILGWTASLPAPAPVILPPEEDPFSLPTTPSPIGSSPFPSETPAFSIPGPPSPSSPAPLLPGRALCGSSATSIPLWAIPARDPLPPPTALRSPLSTLRPNSRVVRRRRSEEKVCDILRVVVSDISEVHPGRVAPIARTDHRHSSSRFRSSLLQRGTVQAQLRRDNQCHLRSTPPSSWQLALSVGPGVGMERTS